MNDDLNKKIVNGLERLSDAFKTLLWQQAKTHGISPIQIQILLFIARHKWEYRNVSHLARELNVTKPTISDAVRVLIKKGYLEKDFSSTDKRSYALSITPQGKQLANTVSTYANPIEKQLDKLAPGQKENLFNSITHIIYQLNQAGILEVQRTCFACRFYEQQGEKHYCNLLNKTLKGTAIRLDCPEFQAAG